MRSISRQHKWHRRFIQLEYDKKSVATTTTPMSIKDNKIWNNNNEEYDAWYKVAETMDNYQEWDNPPIILEGLKLIISPFITRYHFLHQMFSKFIYLMLFCTFEARTITRKAIIYILKQIFKTTTSTPKVINHASATPRNDATPVMVVGNSAKIFVQVNCLV